jgi:hypothetical protein
MDLLTIKIRHLIERSNCSRNPYISTKIDTFLVIAMLKDKIFGKDSSSCGCCGTRIVGLRQVNVGELSTGIMGLDETFREYFKKGKKPEDGTGDELVVDLRKLNFIVEGAEEMY